MKIIFVSPLFGSIRHKPLVRFLESAANAKMDLRLVMPESVELDCSSVWVPVTRFRDGHKLWQKERLLNLYVESLKESYDAVAWIDADIEVPVNFVSKVTEALENKLVVQLWRYADFLGPNDESLLDIQSFMGIMTKADEFDYMKSLFAACHPGFGWAYRREAWEGMGGLYDHNPVADGDMDISRGIMGQLAKPIRGDYVRQAHLYKWGQKAVQAVGNNNIGFTDVTIRHVWHGEVKTRRYGYRNQILERYMFNPELHLEARPGRLLKWSREAPEGLKKDVADWLSLQ